MKKEELRRLRALPATKEMMEKGKRYKEIERVTWWNHKKETVKIHEYDVLFRVQNLSGFIKIAVFLPEDMEKDRKTPRYEVFVNEQGEEYITRELDEDGKEKRWLTSMINNLDGVPGFNYWSKTKYFISRDGMNTLNGLELRNKREAKGPDRLQAWQQEIKNENTRRREEREQRPWDEDMKLVPKIPPSFEEWMRRDAASEYYIIYEYKKNGAKQGYCTRCKKMVPISGPLHDKETKCQACKAEATFKASGRIKTLSTDWYYAEIIQKIKGGIVVRGYKQRQWYRCKDYKKPNINTAEEERTLIFEDGRIKKYKWGLYKNKYHRWIPERNYIPEKRTYWWTRKIKLYKRNLPQLKRNGLLKKSTFDLWEELPTAITSYIAIEKKNPVIEMLARIGMFRLAKEMMQNFKYDTVDETETELAKILRIDKSRLKRLQGMNAGTVHLRWMQYEKTANTIWPDEMIKDFGEQRILSSDFGFLNIPISYVKCYNYLKKQAGITGESMHQMMITWRDYTNMANQLKMNTKLEQIAKPKDVKLAHDELVLLNQKKGIEKQAKEIAKKWPKVNKQLPKLKKFEFQNEEYLIVAPGNITDIVMEGTILRHCVHTCDYYFDRIQTDESYLFFLRKKASPDMPWYTLEVEPSGNIRQKRTTGDNQNADFQKAVPFLKKWQQYFKKQLTKKEKELGEKSNLLRMKNYSELRKNGNRVWHGKLAGQLLADVLETDFMEAN